MFKNAILSFYKIITNMYTEVRVSVNKPKSYYIFFPHD